jgi:hypothetical protein
MGGFPLLIIYIMICGIIIRTGLFNYKKRNNMESMPGKLGKKVKDLVTGFQGIATAHTEYLDQASQYIVDCPVNPKTGNYQQVEVDENQLKVVGDGEVVPVKPEPWPEDMINEATVRDTHSGAEGIIIGRMTFLNGCRRLLCRPKTKDKTKLPDAFGLSVKSALVIAKAPSVKLKPKTDQPGGPGLALKVRY